MLPSIPHTGVGSSAARLVLGKVKWVDSQPSGTLHSFFFGCAAQHVGAQFPEQGWNPCPLKWKRGVLTTGPPGRSMEPCTLDSPPRASPNRLLTSPSLPNRLQRPLSNKVEVGSSKDGPGTCIPGMPANNADSRPLPHTH